MSRLSLARIFGRFAQQWNVRVNNEIAVEVEYIGTFPRAAELVRNGQSKGSEPTLCLLNVRDEWEAVL